MDVYSFLSSLNNPKLFKNIGILIAFLYIFKKIKIGLNVIFGLFLGFLVIMYFYNRDNIERKVDEEQLEKKKEYIKPKLKEIDNSKKDIIDFIFSIQDFYIYNSPAFEEMVENLEIFFQLHRLIRRNIKHGSYYYQIAESKKNNALNALHSIIYSLPNNVLMTEKYDRAHQRLETLLNKYLNEMYDTCTYSLRRDGYNIFTRIINTGPKEYNHYFDKDFGYQFY